MPTKKENTYRVLVIDDNEDIHGDVRKILTPVTLSGCEFEAAEAACFGEMPLDALALPRFEIDSAFQGKQGLELVEGSLREGRPYAMAFVDVRMPPGWDGIETTTKLWQMDPDLQVVICTAYSDYSWGEIVRQLGHTDRLLILKKPFANVEVVQLAVALTEKWRLYQQSKSRLKDLEEMVGIRTEALEQTNARLTAANVQLELATTRAQDMAEGALIANRAKSDFLATMSHEIRTPMNGVLGMINLLLDTPLTEDQLDFARTVQTSAESLLTILNDILDFSKIEAGKLVLEKEVFELPTVIGNVLDLLSERADQQGLEFCYWIDRDVPSQLLGDSGRVRQLLLNLLGNAIKFTKKGSVYLRVSRPRVPGNLGRLLFAIQDTGIGLAEEARGRLFHAFTQADSSTTRKFGGTGLGLSICRKLVDAMGGSIGVESTLGQGSTFWFTLPLEEQPVHAPALPICHPNFNGQKVLVVGECAVQWKVLQEHLAFWGMRAECAAGPAQALETLRHAAAVSGPFTTAIIGNGMVQKEALALVGAVKMDSVLAKTRLVLLTGRHAQPSPSALGRLGIAACLLKPIQPGPLLNALTTPR